MLNYNFQEFRGNNELFVVYILCCYGLIISRCTALVLYTIMLKHNVDLPLAMNDLKKFGCREICSCNIVEQGVITSYNLFMFQCCGAFSFSVFTIVIIDSLCICNCYFYWWFCWCWFFCCFPIKWDIFLSPNCRIPIQAVI